MLTFGRHRFFLTESIGTLPFCFFYNSFPRFVVDTPLLTVSTSCTPFQPTTAPPHPTLRSPPPVLQSMKRLKTLREAHGDQLKNISIKDPEVPFRASVFNC